jgi:hypothetical protein
MRIEHTFDGVPHVRSNQPVNIMVIYSTGQPIIERLVVGAEALAMSVDNKFDKISQWERRTLHPSGGQAHPPVDPFDAWMGL